MKQIIAGGIFLLVAVGIYVAGNRYEVVPTMTGTEYATAYRLDKWTGELWFLEDDLYWPVQPDREPERTASRDLRP